MHSTKEKIKNDLAALGIVKGDTVLMHSSFKSLGEFEGGASLFFEAFFEVLGEEGTLILPALSYESVTLENPVFDINETPSCVGYLTEYFRTKITGVCRSLHATHSCCAKGKFAEEITKGHEMDETPVGNNSPFSKLVHFGGKILMLGCSLDRNTSMHGVEETAIPPYCIDKQNPIVYTLKNKDKTIEKLSYRHNFLDEKGRHIAQRYSRIIDLLSDDEKKFGKVLEAECVVMDARALWEKGHKKLVEDPLFFVDYPID